MLAISNMRDTRNTFKGYELRDSLVTAYVQATTGTKTTLLAGDSNFFHDLLEVSFANNSTVVVTNVTLSDDGTTVRIVDVPVDGTVQIVEPVPFPQGAKGGNWQIDIDDITGTNVDVTALFIRRANLN